MALSSRFPTTNEYIEYWIEVIQNSRDFTNNTSNVTVKVWIERTNTGYTTYGTGTVSANINGGTYSASITTDDKITSTPIVLFEKTLTIPHNSDGTKTLTVSASISHSVFDASSHSYSAVLVSIPRATTPTLSASTVNYGATVRINLPRADTSFTHNLRFSWNDDSGVITSGVGDYYDWLVPLSLMNNIPNATASWGTIYVDTISGGQVIGTKSIRLDTTVPSTVVPTFTSVTAADTATFLNGGVSTNVATFFGAYVQSVSKPKFTINGAQGAYSSTISKYTITFEGVTYSANNSIAGVIKGSGTIVATATITDTRGRTATKTVSLTVLVYAAPKVTVLSIERALVDGTLNAMGTYAKITRSVTWNNLNAKNPLSIVTKSKLRGAATWTTNNTTAAGTTGSYSTGLTVGTFAATSSYDFQIEFTDLFKTTISLAVMATGEVTMSMAPAGIGVGKIWEQGALDVAGDMFITGKIYGNLGALRIPASANLDSYENEGLYYCPLSADAATMSNVPQAVAFSLWVEKHAGTKQTFTTYSTTGWKIYVRNKYQTTWGPWSVTGNDLVFTNVTLQNGAVAAAGRIPRYSKNGELVVVEGEIGSVASNTIIGTLPAGYRPPSLRIFKMGLNSSATNDGATVYVNTDGTIVVQVSANTTQNIALNGIIFYAI